jgi:lipopolysaccharide export system permease protein
MKFTPTLSVYLARLYALNFAGIMAILLGIIYLFDTLELLRRASKRDDLGLSTILQMGLYKLPDMGQIILPFAILFSAMFTFWLLSRRHELVVVRASGFSVWQFLAPVMAVAALVGVLQFAVINPLGAALLGRYESLEARYLSHGKSLVTLFDEGLWLRQTGHDKTGAEKTGTESGYIILHADRIALPEWEMSGVMALFFDAKDGFEKRIDSGTARLENGEWVFSGALIHQPQKPVESLPSIRLPTELTTEDIEESFSSPRAHSFWRLPGYIRTLAATGFDATRLKIHFNALLAQPVLFLAMVLLAATVSLRPPRAQGTFALIISGVMIGFLIFFLTSFLQALGTSQQIPVLLAAWSPALVTLFLGLAVLLNLEDG